MRLVNIKRCVLWLLSSRCELLVRVHVRLPRLIPCVQNARLNTMVGLILRTELKAVVLAC